MTDPRAGPLPGVRSTRDLLFLAILRRAPAHGAEVYERYVLMTGRTGLLLTGVYQTLHRLDGLGLAEPIGVRPDARHNSTSYRITRRGEFLLDRYLRELGGHPAAAERGTDETGPARRSARS